MSTLTHEVTLLRSAFLDYFPEDCREGCLVAMAAATRAAQQVAENKTSFEKVSEILAHRFGRCALGPEKVGECGEEKTVCQNDVVAGIKFEPEAIEILSTI